MSVDPATYLEVVIKELKLKKPVIVSPSMSGGFSLPYLFKGKYKKKKKKIWIPEINVKILKIWTPEKFAVITLKFEQGGFIIE